MANETYVALVPVLVTLAWTLGVGVRRLDAAIVVNALASLGAVALPLAVEVHGRTFFGADVSLGVVLPLWIGIAGVLHMLGMLGWYDAIRWWDHVTHAVSAALVAAVVYAWILVVGPDALPGPLSKAGAGGATIALTIAAGVCWELIEWIARAGSDRIGIERVLKHYGRFDTPLDLLFNAVGAAFVVAFDVRLFVFAFEPIPDPTRQFLSGSIALLTIGSLAWLVILVDGRRAS